MPHATNDDATNFKLIQMKELHPTFGAEVDGVDFSKPVPEEVFSEIYKAITKVSITLRFHISPVFHIVNRQLLLSPPFLSIHPSSPSVTTHPGPLVI
jgi:hypothetical protein